MNHSSTRPYTAEVTAAWDSIPMKRWKHTRMCFYLATLTILGLYVLSSCSSVFMVFPVSMMSLEQRKRKLVLLKQRMDSSCGKRKVSTYLHNQHVLSQKRSIVVVRLWVRYIWLSNRPKMQMVFWWEDSEEELTFPVSVDKSSPPMTLISPVDWSFWRDRLHITPWPSVSSKHTNPEKIHWNIHYMVRMASRNSSCIQ